MFSPRVSYRILQDTGSAEDAAQNVWLWAAKNMRGSKKSPAGEIQAYLVTAGKPTSYNLLRKEAENCASWMISRRCSRQRSSLLSGDEDREIYRMITDILLGMPEKYVEVLEMEAYSRDESPGRLPKSWV